MPLKQLTLTGYKTFANKTKFEFGAGITAVIGRNGSGKSNVADAIRWALGEQAFSLLRSKRTDDMIFAGSPKRARASMAEVLMVFDNTDGFFPIEYSEIEIGRRAYRDVPVNTRSTAAACACARSAICWAAAVWPSATTP